MKITIRTIIIDEFKNNNDPTLFNCVKYKTSITKDGKKWISNEQYTKSMLEELGYEVEVLPTILKSEWIK